jgi:serine phosphatase RsbU (regulator of sigma subunit)
VEVVSTMIGNSVQEISEALEKDIREFSRSMPQLDDMTLMIVKKGKQ